MKPKILDISPIVSPRLAVFPGDQPFERRVSLTFARGDSLELSAMLTTLHAGAHADAPSHYVAGAQSIDQRDLSLYLGLAQVVRVKGLRPGARAGVEDLTCPVRAPRVLIDTQSFPDPDRWNPDFNSLSVELLDHLAGRGVRLVGIDTPSVDPQICPDLPSHQALRRNDMAVLEGLALKDVPEGIYLLIALPLRLEGAEASPVRAVLVKGVEDVWPEISRSD